MLVQRIQRPTIITTHGYLNSAEMQDASAIEMSRRGYVVLALDMYDHGHSINKTTYEPATSFLFGLMLFMMLFNTCIIKNMS